MTTNMHSASATDEIFISIAHDHPAFAGHFPGTPIVPGVVLLDEALHAIGTQIGRDLSACCITAAKFLSPVLPGQTVSVNYDMQSNGLIRFDIMSDDRKISTGSIRS